MPTYEYRCKTCGEHLEVVQSFSDDALTVCPNCEGELRKVFSPVGISFKGSGFYKTDSRSSSRSGSGNGASGNGSGKDGSSEGSSMSSSGSSTSSSGSGGDTSSSSSGAGDSGGSGTKKSEAKSA
jgi:putative FmdB family regulatory protein